MAGINAASRVLGKPELVLGRADAYIGVLIDDLVTKGTSEPYRLLTSRAEYRLLLRHDNADLRLTEIGHELGMIGEARYEAYLLKKQQIEEEIDRLRKVTIKPDEHVQEIIRETDGTELREPMKAADLLKRPEMKYNQIERIVPPAEKQSEEVEEQVEIFIKYEGYIEKSMQQVEKMKKMENKKIPENIDYHAISGIATEAKTMLSEVRPLSIAQASRISGVNPADISILLVYIEQGRIAKISG